MEEQQINNNRPPTTLFSSISHKQQQHPHRWRVKTSKITRVRIVVKLVETVDSWSTVFLSFNEIALTKFRAATKQKSRVWLNPIILDALCAEGS